MQLCMPSENSAGYGESLLLLDWRRGPTAQPQACDEHMYRTLSLPPCWSDAHVERHDGADQGDCDI